MGTLTSKMIRLFTHIWITLNRYTPSDVYASKCDHSWLDTKICQEIVCKEPDLAYLFAVNIPDADLRVCYEAVLKDRVWKEIFEKRFLDDIMDQ